jgi:hypothetical protein
LFGKLRVWDTEANNGVLIYLLLAEHAIEIVADRGVARTCPRAHWDALVARMREAFRAGRFEAGLPRRWTPSTRCWRSTSRATTARPIPTSCPTGRLRLSVCPAASPAPTSDRLEGLGRVVAQRLALQRREVDGCSGTLRSGMASSRWRISASRPRRWSLKSTRVQGACFVCVAASMRSRARL